MVNKYISNIFNSVIHTKTVQHSGISIIGTFINGALGMLFFIFLARNLGPEDFGLLSVSISSLTLLADIADLGVNSSIIKFVGKNIKEDSRIAYQFLKAGLLIKLFLWIAILIIGLLLSPFIAINILDYKIITCMEPESLF